MITMKLKNLLLVVTDIEKSNKSKKDARGRLFLSVRTKKLADFSASLQILS